jgi:hypothetical protein
MSLYDGFACWCGSMELVALIARWYTTLAGQSFG